MALLVSPRDPRLTRSFSPGMTKTSPMRGPGVEPSLHIGSVDFPGMIDYLGDST